jgi:hypothetical protein
MRLSKPVAFLSLLLVCFNSAKAQLKDMPSQAEIDPILESAEGKLKDFEATLTEFKPEAVVIGRDKLDKDLKGIRQTISMIQSAHSGGHNRGINIQRLVGILAAFDDISLDASEWKSLAELTMCEDVIQHRDPSRYDKFATRVTMNLQLLREVGGELFHPTFRAAGAADEIMLAFIQTSPKWKRQAH